MTPAGLHMTECLLQDELAPFGPWPAACVTALSDLGLSEVEIARYFGVSPRLVRLARLCPGPRSVACDPVAPAADARKAAR